MHHIKSIGEFKLELQPGNAQFGSKLAIVCPVRPWNLTDELENNRAPLLCYLKRCAFQSNRWIQTGATVRKRSIRVRIDDFLLRVTLKFDGWPTFKKKRLPLLCCFKLCATFHSHQWIQAGVRVRKRPIWFNIDDYFSRVTLKFDEWHWKTIGYLCWATSSFMHHFIIVCEFKHELRS